MALLQRLLSSVFVLLIALCLWQCARRGNPTGGPKDEQGPVLLRADPENFTTGFKTQTIRLYFDEYVKLQNVQNQLIVSPPLKYTPEIRPQGGASKFVEITLRDTLKENTTYTLNFGQSIVDNNEGNPNSFLTYVFSTGDYIDSLMVAGVVKDAFARKADKFISVMLYERDSSFTDSVVYKKPPNYITNTLDSTIIFRLQNLKAGKYALIAIKDEAKNNLFDPLSDKIGFTRDTLELPTDTTFLLTLFKEIPDYKIATPSLVAANRILFGYLGGEETLQINPIPALPDSIRTLVRKEPGKDTLNFWFTPFETDSLVFEIVNEKAVQRDTFTVKMRKLAADSLTIRSSHRGTINFQDSLYLAANIPLMKIDTTKISLINQDSTILSYQGRFDTINNKFYIDFEKEPLQNYLLGLLPEALTDFYGNTNDTTAYRVSTGSYADYGNLRLTLEGAVRYPLIVQLTNEKGKTLREIYAEKPGLIEFLNLPPATYVARIIYDSNGNRKWDTGDYLDGRQPERVEYYPQTIEVRANWELEQTFTLSE